ncbi:MAG TPA: twin-arginine translocase TatA/TatE family subunit [Candidatus Kapabacteria bacterium]|nr:twin-arginine translocase TatA/TatE family subunit [Candidatus Kapabacteria bacterium]
MFGSLGIWEILVIILIAALLFGGKKLPQLGKSLGEGIMNFKGAMKQGAEEAEAKREKLEIPKEN